jgi:hypothetical protein
VGEVNGSHGVYRPGGAALNAGQVGALRAAEYIANRYADWSVPTDMVGQAAIEAAAGMRGWIERCDRAGLSWRRERTELQERMTRAGAHIRSLEELPRAVAEAWEQWRRIECSGCTYEQPGEVAEALRNRSLCFAHAVYLEAILFALQSGVGSRGSAIVLAPSGTRIHDRLGDAWRIVPEDPTFREKVLETIAAPDGRVSNRWVERRPIPDTDTWFETAWARFRSGAIYEA